MNKITVDQLSTTVLTAKVIVEEVFLSSASTGRMFTSECKLTSDCFTANLSGKEAEIEARTLGSKLRGLRCAQTALVKQNNLGIVRKSAVVEIPANIVHAIVEDTATRQLLRQTEGRADIVNKINALQKELEDYDNNMPKAIDRITRNRAKALKSKKPVTVHI